MACTQGKRAQHGKPDDVVGRDDQPDTGDGQRGRYRVAERSALPWRPGNAGGGKGPQFKTDVESGEVREIGATLANSAKARQLRPASHAEAKEGHGPWSGKPMLAPVVASAVVSARPSAMQQGTHGPAVARSSSARPFVGESMRLVREPDALVAPVRFDERGVETEAMAKLVRHRQPKGADTDMLRLPPPRHTSTLPRSPSASRC